jgi:hypothetical protein
MRLGWVVGRGILFVCSHEEGLVRTTKRWHGRFVTYRRFAPADEQIANGWFTQPVSADTWTLGANIGRGEAGSFHATSNSGCRAACKPAFSGPGVPRAAHERIASDLARTLDLPVPAVCLWTNPASGQLFSVSAWAFAQALTWGEVATRLSGVFTKNVAPAFSAARVFHSWIGDTDHNNNPGNVIVDVASSDADPGVAFIDHAFSMSHDLAHWLRPVAAIPISYIPVGLFDAIAAEAMAAAINDLDEDLIKNIVGRIPDAFLPPDKAQAIINGLIRRKVELRPVFGVTPV